jgi:precorrin-3B methylase
MDTPHIPHAARGQLACVGLGMTLGAHLTPRARGCIESADVVFVAASDALMEAWVATINPRLVSLQAFYAEGRPRQRSYRAMAEAMLAEVRAGRRVVGAFYGHPGVFAQVPHAAIAQARAEGFDAVMEPGVSAEDCLYADLGLDPGTVGCAHYEASQLLFYRRVIDTSAWLVLWQVGLAGDRSYAVRASTVEQRQRLVDRLLRDYPPSHPVTIYEAATLPIGRPRIETLPLGALARATLHMHSTLAIPPARALEPEPGFAPAAEKRASIALNSPPTDAHASP